MQAPVPRPGPRNEGRVNHNWSTPRTTLRISTHHTLVAAQMPNPRTTNHLCPVTVAVYVESVECREPRKALVSVTAYVSVWAGAARAPRPLAPRAPRLGDAHGDWPLPGPLSSTCALLYPLLSLSPSGLCLSIVTVRVLCAVDCVDGSQAQCTKTTSSAGVHVDLKTLYDRAAIPPNEYASRQCQASNQERGTWPPSEPPCRSWPEMPRAWPVNRP